MFSIIVGIARGGLLRFMSSPGARLVDLTVVTLYIQGKLNTICPLFTIDKLSLSLFAVIFLVKPRARLRPLQYRR